MLRPAPTPPARFGAIFSRLLLGLAVLFAVLMLAGVGTVYGAYSRLALSLAAPGVGRQTR